MTGSSKQITIKVIKVIAQILFWVFLCLFFVENSKLRPLVSPAKEVAVVAMIAGFAYLNYFVLYSYLFKRRRYGIYFLLLLGIVVAITFFEMQIVIPDIKKCFLKSNPLILKGFLYNASLYVFLRNFAFIAFAVIFKLYQEAIRARELERERKEIEVENVKTKIAPHFLLNNLSKIHHDVLSDPEKASEKIVLMSDLLRIFLKDIDAQKIPMQQEVNFITDLIALENDERYTNLDIRFVCTGLDLSEKISPLLFETFVSNAFKYVKRENGYIHIYFEKEGKDMLRFTCENN